MNKVIDNYVLKEIIGQGQYGKVYKAFNTHTYGLYAIKVIRMDKFKQLPKLEQFTMNEIKILSKIQHPNIVKFVQILKTVNNLYMVYEYCENGTLEELISMKKFISQKQTISIARQLLSAFKVLSQSNILHRDIKPSNILFNNGVVKLADFGFCKLLEPDEMAKTMVGSPIYMAPEVLRGNLYTSKADVWSLGVVLFECLFGFCPYEDRSIGRLIQLIDNNELHFPATPKVSRQLLDTIRKMLTINQNKRISWSQLCEAEVFQQNQRSTFTLERLQDLQYYKSVESPKITSRSEEQEKSIVSNFILFLSKQRRKILFLINVAQDVMRLNMSSNSTRIGQLLISRSRDIHSRMFKAIHNLNGNHQYTQSQRNDIKNSKELACFVEVATKQKTAIDECYKLYKATDVNKSDEPTLKLYSQELLQYVRQIRAGESVRGMKQRLLHCNMILDCIMLMELYENYVGYRELEEQLYAHILGKMTLQNLTMIVDHKTRYAQKKYRSL